MPKYVPSEGLVYYVNPVVGGIAFYFSFELEPNHNYLVEITDDAVNYSALHTISTVKQTRNIYFTYNVSTNAGPWPRVTDLGPVA